VRIVLDTNILVRANPKASPQGLARELLLKTVSEPHVLVLSLPILVEVQRVLSYSRVQARWPLSDEAIRQYLRLLESAANLVDLPESVPAVVTDPDDDPILQTAILGHADVLCTRDIDFGHPIVRDTCWAHAIRILDDVALMRELRRSQDHHRQ
jgi:putative PIN family toxin of toxin-antitoxin system